jgi:hypothetical protein
MSYPPPETPRPRLTPGLLLYIALMIAAATFPIWGTILWGTP